MNVQNCVRFCVYECGRFQRLDAVIRPAIVVLAGVLTVEECRIDGGVPREIVQLRRQAQQHVPQSRLVNRDVIRILS